MKNKNNSSFKLEKFIYKSLYEEKDGYYMSKNPIGYKGDFITSPNISIFFSEMIAIWIISLWKNQNEPKKFNIIELGAGNGEMIDIIYKSFEKFPKFRNIFKIYILEKSPYLKKIQKEKLKNKKVFWIDNFQKIEKAPSIFLANEFFDALPINQYLKINDRWFQKNVKLVKKNKFKFLNTPVNIEDIEKKIGYKIAKDQKILEISETAINYLKQVGDIIKKNKGGLLIIDYGYAEKKMRDTLRGIRDHKIVNILDNYKKCDITYSLSFYLLMKIARLIGLKIAGITSQRNFLQSLGILERAEMASKHLKFSKKINIFYRIEKLIGKRFMGEVFKVMLITDNNTNFNLGFKTDKIENIIKI